MVECVIHMHSTSRKAECSLALIVRFLLVLVRFSLVVAYPEGYPPIRYRLIVHERKETSLASSTVRYHYCKYTRSVVIPLYDHKDNVSYVTSVATPSRGTWSTA